MVSMSILAIKILNNFIQKEKIKKDNLQLMLEFDNDDATIGSATIMEKQKDGSVWTVEYKPNGKITSIFQIQ